MLRRIALILTILIGMSLYGQDVPTTVVSYYKVQFADLDKYNEMTEKYWHPIMNQLVDDGKIAIWGVLHHQWGDEWNIVVYTTGEDFATVQKALKEGFEKYEENTPERIRKEISSMVMDHKDNIYTHSYSYSGQE